MLPKHLNLPLTMIANLVQRTSHSSIVCDVKIIDLPSLTRESIKSHRNLLLLGSWPLVGSSWKFHRHSSDANISNWEEKLSIRGLCWWLTKNIRDGLPTRAMKSKSYAFTWKPWFKISLIVKIFKIPIAAETFRRLPPL